MLTALRRKLTESALPAPVRMLIVGSTLQTLSTAGFSTYVGIWAIQQLHASVSALGVALFLRAFSGVLTGYLGGRLSDSRGRRPVLIASWLSQAVCIAGFVAVNDRVTLGLTLIVLFGPLGPPGRAAAAAYIADATLAEQRTTAYAAQRSAQALAQILGPACAALLIGGARWGLMFGVLAAASAVAVVVAAVLVPTSAAHHDKQEDDTTQHHGQSSVWRDRPYLLMLAAATGITLTMAATDRFLPIAATSAYEVPAHLWGWLAALNPILVIALQTHLTRRLNHVSPSARIMAAGLLTGLPFLLLLPGRGVGVVATVVVLSTFAEIVWLPLAQALAADLAPPAMLGAYLGAFDGAVSLAFALGPTLALELSAAAGNATVWIVFAVLALLAAVGALAARRRLVDRLAQNAATDP